ncbi:MAG: response regulator, partial [Bacteroidota bacterium]
MLETSPRLLLVDDDEFFLPTLQVMVKRLDYIVKQSCVTYPEAEKAIQMGDFDLALLDINLKRYDTSEEGISLGAKLQEKQKPFIYITALSDKEVIQRAASTQPAAYLLKPLTE